ncbi:uncharacterized protein LOC119435701 [Dermacentor silvarum]|uniref:uncharacterized protein LOC119435701 n=1 Tax=Dermacentor silvarum TaxID=543639 RepID=UPI00189A5CF7|nr:uncharacterized protein LOC119435701 [Dermacentor silvarum]
MLKADGDSAVVLPASRKHAVNSGQEMGGCCHRVGLGRRGRLLLMFGMTTAFFLVEIIVGYVTNSMALVADSFHMLSDVISLVIAFLSIKVRLHR